MNISPKNLSSILALAFSIAEFSHFALCLPAVAENTMVNKSDSKQDQDLSRGDLISGKLDFNLPQTEAQKMATTINEMVCKDFFDENKVNSVWKPAYEANKTSLISQTHMLDFSSRINALLHQLHASHTSFFTENDEAFFFMRSLFSSLRNDLSEKQKKEIEADFTGLGVGGGHANSAQVRYVLDDSPAAKAGFRRGDILKTVNSQPYTGYAVWNQTSGKLCKVELQRQGKLLELKITPHKQDFLKGYLDATEKSARVMQQGGKRIGYIHFWSGGAGSHELLEDALSNKLRDTDALVLDLRDGYGGASMNDIDMFFRPHSAYPDMTTKDRHSKGFERSYYEKPVAVLINSGTRSGKELMSFGLKRSRRATLFGETTAGFVLAGRYSPLNSRAFLYLAVAQIKLDGQDLEGKGVPPDVPLPDLLTEGDPVLKRALFHLSNHLPKP